MRNHLLAYQGGLYWPYLKSMGVYRCPLDKTNTALFKLRLNQLSTYVENGAICGYGKTVPRTYRLGDFRQDAFMMWEPSQEDTSIGAEWTYNDGSSSRTRPSTEGWASVTARKAVSCSASTDGSSSSSPTPGVGNRRYRGRTACTAIPAQRTAGDGLAITCKHPDF